MTGSVWLFVSISQDIYEGDLVAKCYFAKHKLVWEVLDGGLKKKIEIQWSDIMALKENYLDDGPGTLDVVWMGCKTLERSILFYNTVDIQQRDRRIPEATVKHFAANIKSKISLRKQSYTPRPKTTASAVHLQKKNRTEILRANDTVQVNKAKTCSKEEPQTMPCVVIQAAPSSA